MKYYVLAYSKIPFFLVDEEGRSAGLDSYDEAVEAAENSPMSRALGYTIIKWDCNDGGVLGIW